jgi:hypothetical protein
MGGLRSIRHLHEESSVEDARLVGTDKSDRFGDITRRSDESSGDLLNRNERRPGLVGAQHDANRFAARRMPKDYEHTSREFTGRRNVKTDAVRKGDIADHLRWPCNHFTGSWLSSVIKAYNPKVDQHFNLG